MRLNKFIAENTELSRRAADLAIEQGNVTVDGEKAILGATISPSGKVMLSGIEVKQKINQNLTILLNKPVGYVCSKDGQGSPTVYNLLPSKYQNLNIAGRLDKDSCGLVLLTNDGGLLNQLTHPRYNKTKIYEVRLNKPLVDKDKVEIQRGVTLDDGQSQLDLIKLDGSGFEWQIKMHQGRNRQIRRTFAKLDYKVIGLNRTDIANYSISDLQNKKYIEIDI